MRTTLVLLVMLCGCTNDAAARKTLDDSGYTDVKIGGPAPFSCDDKDTFSNHFHARNPTGRYVDGVVCCGVWKACTIRF